MPRRLTKVDSLCYGRKSTQNKIIQADNLDALQYLLRTEEGQVKCVYIDPPYNNQEKYTHYTDGMDHEQWLNAISTRLPLLFRMLREDGTLWISIDDREVHYLKVAADSILGRDKFVTTIIWQQRTTRENRKAFSNNHEYILLYAKNPKLFAKSRNLIPHTTELLKRYRNPDNDPRGPWQSVSANVQAGHATPSQFYELVSPSGKRHVPPKGRCWVYNKSKMVKEIEQNNIWFGEHGQNVPRLKRFLRNASGGIAPDTIWTAQQVGSNNDAKKHSLMLFPKEELFDTPKPERLIQRIIEIATDPGESVLDAYLGSGTTAAVSHKMNRRYIGIEAGKHAVTHCVSRLRSVVDGEQGGISSGVGWKGGGGFHFYRLD